MQLKSYLTHRNIFLFGLVLLATGIPVSRFLVSVSQIILLCNWLLERNFIYKWNCVKKSKAFWAFTGIFIFYLIGLIWTEDYTYAAKDLRIKLPMLWLPVLFFTSPHLTNKEYHTILHFFVGATLAATFWSLAVYLGITPIEVHDVRDISRFESHIRFSLMIVLSILYLFFVLLRKDEGKYKLIYVAVMLWLLYFLFLLQSFTGIIIIAIIAFTALSWILVSKNSVFFKFSFTVLIAAVFTYLSIVTVDEWKMIRAVNMISFQSLPLKSFNGNWYINDTLSKSTENGNLVWINVCPAELNIEWDKRSKIPYLGQDHKGNELSTTLIRYLTSKGISKDSAGVNKLTAEDQKNIENGFPNYKYTNTSNLRTRIHEIIWELDASSHKQDPTGHSLSMRYEFWKTAWHIIQKNPAIGVGTGDLEKALKQQYQNDKTILNPKWQLHSHNQFLAVGIALGFTGIFLFAVFLLAPFLFTKKISHFFVFFLLIQFLSFFNEDTLETQAGVTFCLFFTQLLFHNDEYNL